jgi:hypothetical protein
LIFGMVLGVHNPTSFPGQRRLTTKVYQSVTFWLGAYVASMPVRRAM